MLQAKIIIYALQRFSGHKLTEKGTNLSLSCFSHTWNCSPLKSLLCFHRVHERCTLVYSVLHARQSYTSSRPRSRWLLPVRTQTPSSSQQEKKRSKTRKHDRNFRKKQKFKLTTLATVWKFKPESLIMSPSLNIGHRGALSGWYRQLLM